MTTVEQDREQAHINRLIDELRDVEADWRRGYARILGVVAELEQARARAVTGFGTTAPAASRGAQPVEK